MTDHLPNSARFADPEQVARDIVHALERRSPDVLYTPKVWRYVMTAVRANPGNHLQTPILLRRAYRRGRATREFPHAATKRDS